MKNGIGEEYFPAIEVEDIFSGFGQVWMDLYRRMREVSLDNFEWVDPAKRSNENISTVRRQSVERRA